MPKTSAKTKPVSDKKTQSAHDHAGHNHNHQHTDGPSILGENIKFELSVAWETVKKEYEKALQAITSQVEIAGFRKGKAPATMVEEKVGKTKIYEETISRVLSPAYADEIQKRNLKPIIEPHIHPKSLEEGKDWVFEIETAEYPEITLGNYQDIVKGVKTSDALWVPGKEEKQPEENAEDAKLQKIFQALLEKVPVKVPELIIRQEVTRSLSRLVQQLDRLHITLEDYLKSVSKTIDQLRQEFAVSALTTLQIEFILNEIAKAEKLEVSDKEIDDIIGAIPDETVRKAGDLPGQRAMVGSTLIRRKVIEKLLSL